MDSTNLKNLQAPLKEKYKADPESAVITLKAKGKIDEGITCKVETGRAIAVAGLHPATGGDELNICSGDMLLEALVACAGVTLKAVTTSIGIQIEDGTIRAEGDLDFAWNFRSIKRGSGWIKNIRLFFELNGNLTEEQLSTISKLTERYCVVYQTLFKGVEIKTEFHSI